MSDDSLVTAVVRALEARGLLDRFRLLCNKGAGRDWLLVLPESLAEKAELDDLVKAGLLAIETQDFRYDSVTGRIKANEVICRITQLGLKVAARLERAE